MEDWRNEMALREQVAKDMCALQHCEWKGVHQTVHLFGEGDTEQAEQHAWRLLNETSFKPGEKYAGVRYATEEERARQDWPNHMVFVILKTEVA